MTDYTRLNQEIYQKYFKLPNYSYFTTQIKVEVSSAQMKEENLTVLVSGNVDNDRAGTGFCGNRLHPHRIHREFI